jgi:tRNA pseudouridine13 synthase
MKVKFRPEDFQVEELTDVQPGGSGPFAFYELRKKGIGTPEAIQIVCRELKVPDHQLSYGGRKDRHAVTTQYLTIRNGRPRSLRRGSLQLRYLGRTLTPFESRHIRANRFRITLRAMNEADVDAALAALKEVRRDGVPNYFDDQRFGSVGRERQFIARKLIDGDYEAALRLALVEPYEFDRAAEKEEKRILRKNWGDWGSVQAQLRRGPISPIVAHLTHNPTDFRGAFARLRPDLKTLWLAAYQSHLWNRLLSRWLDRHCRTEQMVPLLLRLGPVHLCRNLDDKQRAEFHAQQLPLPSARLRMTVEDPLRELVNEVMREEGLALAQMKLKHFREPFFSKGDRAAFLVPANVEGRMEPDELQAGKMKLLAAFELPRGCYATMVIKSVVSGSLVSGEW